jgi:Zn-dependent metalloprotease
MGAGTSRGRAVLTSAGFLLLLIAVSPVQGAGGGSGGDAQINQLGGERSSLSSLIDSGARVAYHSETGKVRFIGSAPRSPFSRPPELGPSTSPTAVARAFLDRHGKAFGISDQARELRVTSARTVSAGRSVVRFQQVHEGVRVLGGELVVNLDRGGNVLSAGGEVVPAPNVSVAPRIESSAARETALAAVARTRGVPVSTLQASEPGLWIYDSRIMGGPGLGRPTLVWRMDVTGEGKREPIDEFVLVDAQLGMVALQFDQLEKAKYRQICDANNADAKVPCTTPFARVEGGAASAIQDVNDAYDYSGDTYDFYSGTLGRDSIDDDGMMLKSTTRYCESEYDCPYQNAYWNGEQMVYGEGFASADDVVGHELTHGVTQYTSQLFYYYQSGAINESLSDVFGEFVDQTYGPDDPADKWLIGEDLSGGAGRDMENPPAYGDPDRMTSPNYTADAGGDDAGGVHTNSGVNNKAAFLITDGDDFNGKTVTGLGITKAAKIYYEVETNLLTSASDYADLYNALQQACTNLVGTAGITSLDCAEVTDAVQAVEMSTMPPAAPNPEAPVCPAGQSPQDLFFDDLEDTASGNWTTQLGSGDYNTWYYPQNPNDIGLDATYATSGTTNFWGYDQEYTADYRIAMTRSVAIPAGSTPYLRFNHSYGFENIGTSTYDGGVLEYSTNGGTSWVDAGSLLTDNGYNGTISGSYDNPLGGRSAFVRESNGYISSRAGLSSLAGQSVRFRFRIGTDFYGWDYGWFVDDIRLYTCSPPTFAFSSATYSVGEAGPTASVTINRTGLTTATDSVHFSTVDGTATAGSDYTDETQTVTFDPGDTQETVPIPITDDSTVESDETVSLSLSDPSTGAALGDPHAATLTILDNDVATLAFSAVSYSVGEAGPAASITVTRSRNTSSDVSVHFATTASGTAQAGSDYTSVSQDVSFSPGDNEETVSIPITDDSLIENSETVSLALSGPSAEAHLGSPSAATLTIVDNDRAFAFSSAGYSVGEAGPTASVTIKRTGLTTGTDSIHIATSDGTAKAGSDYTAVSQTVFFTAGQTSKTVSAPITDDAAYEGNETVLLTLSSPSTGATLGDPHAATLTIVDNDVATLTFSAASYSVGEAGPAASITIGRTGATASASTVHFATVNGTATASDDYTRVSTTVSFAAGETSKAVPVPITDDKLVEGREALSLVLSSPSAGAALGSQSTATLLINDNDHAKPGRIASAKLSKKVFKRAQARKVKLVVKFSPASKKFNYVLSIRKNGKWRKVKTVKRTGTFTGTRRMTVKSLFKGKAVKKGRYRIKLIADSNSKTLAFRVK